LKNHLEILKKRIGLAETLRKESFVKQFDFNGSEKVEVDPEKEISQKMRLL